ncbi:hypothetical protein N7454_003227 [Penicillium verhagenii]|nr:hypothetical protein N7454_003227 [Penicillium verhagenii]
MTKKKSNRKAGRNARDIQTPASDEEILENKGASTQRSPSPQAESSRSASTRARYSTKNNSKRANSAILESELNRPLPLSKSSTSKGKAPERKTRFARSPTEPGDFAPNAGTYDSNEEEDSDNESSTAGSPMEVDTLTISSWVREIIKSETSRELETILENYFHSVEPQYDQCLEFFQAMNIKINMANKRHNVTNIQTGTIPENGYNSILKPWHEEARRALNPENLSPDKFWSSFASTQYVIKEFNRRHHLPYQWNIRYAWAETLIDVQDSRPSDLVDDIFFDSDEEQAPLPSTEDNQADTSEESDSDSEYDMDRGEPTGLDALEARTISQQRRLNSAKVLYWWPKGTGSQIFVRYGDRSAPIYRIRAGSHESYNRSRVERVLITQTRGTAKVLGTRDGVQDEFWSYTREGVEDIVGIGWKVEDDNEDGLNPLDLIEPAKGAIYPQTRILVKWRDGVSTLEGRSFIRRITVGSALDGDRVIYQKAEELELSYRQKHGLEALYDDGDEYEESDEESDGTGEESDNSIQPRPVQSRRYRSEPTHGKHRHNAEDYTKHNRDVEAYRRHRSEPARHRRTDHRRGATQSRNTESDRRRRTESTRYKQRDNMATQGRGTASDSSESASRPIARKKRSKKAKGQSTGIERELQRLNVGSSKSTTQYRNSRGRTA